MARSLSPFTRITLLINDLNAHKVEDLADVTKCDLLHHTAKLHEEIENSAHKQSAVTIGEQGKTLLSSIQSGNLAKAEGERNTLLASCKQLKRLI